MKFLSATMAALIFGVVILRAQEPPLPAATETPAPSPSARPQLDIPDIPMTVEPSPLVPNTSPAPKKTVPSLPELDAAFQHSSLGQAVEEQRLHLEWRKLKNRASADPEVIAAKKAVDTARPRTDVEKRNLMRTYYKVFYAHMQALAETPEIKPYLEQKKKEALNSLAQPTLHPDPTPTPSPSATP
jgi:regulator of replication initiation timing